MIMCRQSHSRMIPVHSFIHFLCFASALLLSSAYASSSAQTRAAILSRSGTKDQGGRRSHWGPQHFLGWMPMRSRRAELDNRISTIPAPPMQYRPRELSPEAADMGESIMDEFLMYLTLKDAGLLDLCLQYK